MCEHLTTLLARRTPFSQAKSEVLTANTTIKQKAPSGAFLFYGRSAEVRTPGLMVPNQLWTVFAIISPHLDAFPLGKPCFRDLLRTLFPHSPLPYMVYTVVKAINQPQKLHPVYDFLSHHHVNIQSPNLQPCV